MDWRPQLERRPVKGCRGCVIEHGATAATSPKARPLQERALDRRRGGDPGACSWWHAGRRWRWHGRLGCCPGMDVLLVGKAEEEGMEGMTSGRGVAVAE
jgi:hypothetical protein